jgi:thiamine-monophosphate kinase
VFDPDTPVSKVGERALVKHLRSRIPSGQGVVVGVGDDAAAVETAPLTLVTTDALVEGIHFRREWSPPRLLGRKALTVNLADIAAMAGIPRHATVSLCLPPDVPMRFVDGLYDGLLERAAETGVNLVGGNVASSWAELVVDVTLLGTGDRVLKRAGAVPGDLAVVTGALGAAAAGLRLLSQGARLNEDGFLESTGVWTETSADAVQRCLKAQLDPAPPLALARALAEQELVHAAMDISDGLSGDLLSLCQESQLGAVIDPESVPIDKAAHGLMKAQGGDGFALAMHGGEDYQFLFAIPPDRLDGLKDLAVVWDLPLTVVGEFIEGPAAVHLKRGDSLRPLENLAFDHFREKPGGRSTPKSAS